MFKFLKNNLAFYLIITNFAQSSTLEYNFSIHDLEKYPEYTQKIIEYNLIADSIDQEMHIIFNKEKFQTHTLNGESTYSAIKAFALIKNEVSPFTYYLFKGIDENKNPLKFLIAFFQASIVDYNQKLFHENLKYFEN